MHTVYTPIYHFCVCVCVLYTYILPTATHLYTKAGHIYEMLPPYQVVSNSRARIMSSLIYSLKLSHRECSILFPAGTIPSCNHCFHIICILT